MGCDYEWSGRTVLKTFHGFITGPFFIKSAELVGADSRFEPLLMIYNDFRRVTGHSIDAAAYQRVAACRLGSIYTNPNFRVAFVSVGVQASQLIAAFHPNLHGLPFDPVVFDTLAQAESWYFSQVVLDGTRSSS